MLMSVTIADEELLRGSWDFVKIMLKIYFIKDLIKYFDTLMDVHVKNNYRYSKAQS